MGRRKEKGKQQRYGRRKEEVEDRQPLKYGDVEITPEEEAILKQLPGFTTFDAVSLEEIEVATQMLMAKIRWELRSQEEREGEVWSEAWEERMMEKTVYDDSTHKLDFNKQRVTDMKSCRRIRLPQPTDTRTEVIMVNMLQRVLEKTKNYRETKCDKKGFPRQNNLSKIEKEGLRSLQTKVKRAELVVQATDKSKKLAFCSIESYNKSMQPHANDPTISWEEQRQLERQLNGHTLQFGRLLRLGKAWGDNHVARVKSALRSKNALKPPLYGLRKGHKPIPPGQEEIGPPTTAGMRGLRVI